MQDDKQRRFSAIIVEESTRLNDILTEFLDFARPKRLRPATCRIEDILDRNLSVMEAECQRLGVSVQRCYQTGYCYLEADQDLLYRAFVNIFANSLQAMQAGGTLTIRTAITNGMDNAPFVEIQVHDTGTGIHKDAMKKIFNPFFTTREKGTGLGLAIVQTIIDNHSGEIEVVGGEGQGATFIIRLPLEQSEFEAEDEDEE